MGSLERGPDFRAITMHPVIYSQYDKNKVIVPASISLQDFQIKYPFPIIPICCDGENVDFIVGCDYYFINKNNDIGYLELTYEYYRCITPKVVRVVVRKANETKAVEKRMLKIAKLLLFPVSESLSSQIQDLNCDLPKFFEFKKKLLDENEIIYNPVYPKRSFTFGDTVAAMQSDPPRFRPKKLNNSNVTQVNNSKETFIAKENKFSNQILKRSDNKYQKINENQEIQNFNEEIEEQYENDKWVYQDYDHSYDLIPKINEDYVYYIVNKSQKSEIGLNDEYYYPVIAFRGVFNDRVFFFYGPSLFVVSITKQIAGA